MCFTPTSSKPDRTSRDVICYKVMTYNARQYPFCRRRLKSSIYTFEYKMGKTYRCDSFPLDLMSGWHDYCTRQGFYAWTDLDTALDRCRYMNRVSRYDNYVVVSCVIPRGSMCYESTDDLYYPRTLCANRIRLRKFLHTDDEIWYGPYGTYRHYLNYSGTENTVIDKAKRFLRRFMFSTRKRRNPIGCETGAAE